MANRFAAACERQELRRQGQATELLLPYLSAAGVAAYLRQRFGEAQVPERLVGVLRQRTNGNPFFMIAVVDDWVRQDILQKGAAGWELAGDIAIETVGVPETLRQLIAQQLAQMSPEERGVLEAASMER